MNVGMKSKMYLRHTLKNPNSNITLNGSTTRYNMVTTNDVDSNIHWKLLLKRYMPLFLKKPIILTNGRCQMIRSVIVCVNKTAMT